MRARTLASKVGMSSIFLAMLGLTTSAFGGAKEQCYRMHNRLTGTPPNATELAACEAKVSSGDAFGAAKDMTANKFFLNDTIRSVFTPWTSETGDPLNPFNDFTATAMGLVKGDVDFRRIMDGDQIYSCTGVAPAVAAANNTHYTTCGTNADIQAVLAPVAITTAYPQFAAAPADKFPSGMYSTRGFGSTYYEAGTNRAPFAYTLKYALCEEIDAFHDTSIADFKVRQDVDRNPGGAAKTYLNECKGCHAGMDPMASAFAFVDFNATTNTVVYTEGTIASKFHNNQGVFPEGFHYLDDNWENFWNRGQNARVGWGAAEGTIMKGAGLKSWATMVSNTDQFARCMAKQAVRKLCVKEADLKGELIRDLADEFKANGYKMKDLYAKAATSCMGE